MQTKLGQKAKDVITGFSGVVTGKCTYITGCSQSLMIPPVKPDGELIAGQWVDDDRLEITSEDQLKLAVEHSGPDLPPPRSY